MDEIKKKDDLLKYIKICVANCNKTHDNDGNCVMCGKGWGEHGGHNCISTGNRGAWVIK
jgi:hypothetical protein